MLHDKVINTSTLTCSATQKYADKKETGRSEMDQPNLDNEKPIFTKTPWPIIDYLNNYFASDGLSHFFDNPSNDPGILL